MASEGYADGLREWLYTAESQTYWTAVATIVTLNTIGYCLWESCKNNRKPAGHDQVLIVLSTEDFPFSCVAMAAKAFKMAGLRLVLCTAEGGSSKPQPAKEAEELKDKASRTVSRIAGGKMPALWHLRAKNFVAVFIAGGPKMLRDLQKTDLNGKLPTVFCEELQEFCAKVLKQAGVVGATGHGALGLPGGTPATDVSPELSIDERARIFTGSVDSMATKVASDMVAILRPSAALEATASGTVTFTPKLARELWKATVDYGSAIWGDPCKPLDGLVLWQPIKAASSNALGTGTWSPVYLASLAPGGMVGTAPLAELELREKEATKQGREDAHFYAQLLRIPLREECSVHRFLQLAYNAGQLSASGALARLGAEDSKWKELYDSARLGQPDTYIGDFENFENFMVPSNLLRRIRAAHSRLGSVVVK